MSPRLARPVLCALAAATAVCVALSACFQGPRPQEAWATPEQISQAVRSSLPLLQSSALQWFEERSCTSCHHYTLGLMSVALAAERGFTIDASMQAELIPHGVPDDPGTIEEVLQGDAGINGQLGQGYKLLALAAAKIPANEHTDARARFLLDKQGPEGRWRSVSHRPPLEDCDMTATALAVRAIQLYAPRGSESRVARAVALSRHWLAQFEPRHNEERTLQLLGLAWTGADAGRVRGAARGLMAKQRPDGGWSQLDSRESDAYATGQALVALHQAGGISVQDSCYRRGVAFLVNSQRSDGTWYLETRRRGSGLAHFETGFPHGEHQFIAYAATAWASMALTFAAQPGPSSIFLGNTPLPRAAEMSESENPLPPLVRAACYGSIDELRRLLDAGEDVEHASANGFTALMAAAHDRDKAQLLLERGALLEARSKLGQTALIQAAGVHAGRGVVELLLARGADLRARSENGSSALSRAVESGDCELVGLLLRAGAQVDAPSFENLPALHLAVWQGDLAMLGTLLAHGADPDGKIPAGDGKEGGTPLIAAATDGFPQVVAALLEAGARIEAVDEIGRTALAWAAIVDWGDDRTLSELLRRGASPQARDREGISVLEHARRAAKPSALSLLQAKPR